jgi:hypothetical protein
LPSISLWNIKGWPAVFVIDAAGTIRYRHLRRSTAPSRT